MKTPSFVTFTGIDDKTDLRKLCDLSDKYPIEWGVLFGKKNDNRYPTQNRIDLVTKLGIKLSAHLCRQAATDALDGKSKIDLTNFSRVQINSLSYNIPSLETFHRTIEKPVILQHRTGGFPTLPEGIFALHDQSGGKGTVPRSRPIQFDAMPRLVGYAGGIGPENVVSILDEIFGHHFWIDMETNIRTDGWLDVDKCEAVCKAVWG